MNRSRFLRTVNWLVAFGSGAMAAGCIDFPEDFSLLPNGTPFVISGTATIIDNAGPCAVWIGDNGVTYHLFQTPQLENELFDTVTTPGTTSRLEVATRTDLVVTCQLGTIVEIRDVLEVVE